MKIIDHLVVKFNNVTIGDIILYTVAVVTACYTTAILIVIFE